MPAIKKVDFNKCTTEDRGAFKITTHIIKCIGKQILFNLPVLKKVNNNLHIETRRGWVTEKVCNYIDLCDTIYIYMWSDYHAK